MSGTGDGLDYLRIPYEKIKFGKKLESQGYGTVFEGEFDDQRVALKQLNITNLAHVKPKLLAEILTVSRFGQHPNLVALLGFCNEKSNEMILVYEYVASGNLVGTMMERVKTIQRLELCLGAARGLCYLHTGVDSTTRGIAHGNIKLSKILLNTNASSSKLEAKVSGFGLSNIMPGKGQKTSESYDEGREKRKMQSDVYSFGMLLLEVLCGSSKVADIDDACRIYPVSELVPKKMKQNKLRQTVDIHIRTEIKTEALGTYAAIACQCVMDNPDARPQMAQVAKELEKALRLQGGEGSGNIPTTEEHLKDLLTPDQLGEVKPDSEDLSTIEDVQDVIAPGKLDDAEDANDSEVNIASKLSKSSNIKMYTIWEATKKIAPYWSRVFSLKKAKEDWIAKDGVIGIGITATAIGLIVGGIAAALILIRER